MPDNIFELPEFPSLYTEEDEARQKELEEKQKAITDIYTQQFVQGEAGTGAEGWARRFVSGTFMEPLIKGIAPEDWGFDYGATAQDMQKQLADVAVELQELRRKEQVSNFVQPIQNTMRLLALADMAITSLEELNSYFKLTELGFNEEEQEYMVNYARLVLFSSDEQLRTGEALGLRPITEAEIDLLAKSGAYSRLDPSYILSTVAFAKSTEDVAQALRWAYPLEEEVVTPQSLRDSLLEQYNEWVESQGFDDAKATETDTPEALRDKLAKLFDQLSKQMGQPISLIVERPDDPYGNDIVEAVMKPYLSSLEGLIEKNESLTDAQKSIFQSQYDEQKLLFKDTTEIYIDNEFICFYNTKTKEFNIAGLDGTPADTDEKKESFAKDIWDGFYVGLMGAASKTLNAITSTIPQAIMNMAVHPWKIGGFEWSPSTGVWGQALPDSVVSTVDDWSASLQRMEDERNLNYALWIQAHPELQPREEWTQSAIGNWGVLKDPGWIFYQISSTAPTLGAALLTGTVTMTLTGGNFVAGALAGATVLTPLEIQSLKDDLVAHGCDTNTANEIALFGGSLIGAMEIVPEMIFLKAVSPTLMRLFRKEFTSEITKKTAISLGTKGILGQAAKTTLKIEIAETMEEVLQEALHNAAVKTIDSNVSIIEGLPDLAIKSAISMLPMSLFGGGMNYMEMKFYLKPEIRERLDDLEGMLMEQGFTQEHAQSVALSVLLGDESVEAEIAKAMEEADTIVEEGQYAITPDGRLMLQPAPEVYLVEEPQARGELRLEEQDLSENAVPETTKSFYFYDSVHEQPIGRISVTVNDGVFTIWSLESSLIQGIKMTSQLLMKINSAIEAEVVKQGYKTIQAKAWNTHIRMYTKAGYKLITSEEEIQEAKQRYGKGKFPVTMEKDLSKAPKLVSYEEAKAAKLKQIEDKLNIIVSDILEFTQRIEQREKELVGDTSSRVVSKMQKKIAADKEYLEQLYAERDRLNKVLSKLQRPENADRSSEFVALMDSRYNDIEGLRFSFVRTGHNEVEFDLFEIPESLRSKKLGSKILAETVHTADQYGITLTGDAVSFDPRITLGNLINWYKGFGFEFNNAAKPYSCIRVPFARPYVERAIVPYEVEVVPSPKTMQEYVEETIEGRIDAIILNQSDFVSYDEFAKTIDRMKKHGLIVEVVGDDVIVARTEAELRRLTKLFKDQLRKKEENYGGEFGHPIEDKSIGTPKFEYMDVNFVPKLRPWDTELKHKTEALKRRKDITDHIKRPKHITETEAKAKAIFDKLTKTQADLYETLKKEQGRLAKKRKKLQPKVEAVTAEYGQVTGRLGEDWAKLLVDEEAFNTKYTGVLEELASAVRAKKTLMKEAGIKTKGAAAMRWDDLGTVDKAKVTCAMMPNGSIKFKSRYEFADMRYEFAHLEELTGLPFFDWSVRSRLAARNVITAKEEALRHILRDPMLRKVRENAESIDRVAQYINSLNPRLKNVEAPQDLTPDEELLADTLIEILKEYEPKALFLRIIYTKSTLDAFKKEFKDATEDQLKEALRIKLTGNEQALWEFVQTQDWGLIRRGYDPWQRAITNLFPKEVELDTTRGGARLMSRHSTEYEEEMMRQNVLQRVVTYVTQIETQWHLRHELNELGDLFDVAAPKLENRMQVERILKNHVAELQGMPDYGSYSILISIADHIWRQAMGSVFSHPWPAFRNVHQPAAFHYDRSELVRGILDRLPKNIDALGDVYYETEVHQLGGIRMDWLMAGTKGIQLPKIPVWLQPQALLLKVSDNIPIYTKSDNIPRHLSFKSSLNKAWRATEEYNRTGDVSKWLENSGANSLTQAEINYALGILAQDDIHFDLVTKGMRNLNSSEYVSNYIAHALTDRVHFVYERSQRASVEHRSLGRILGNLATFPRQYTQRVIQDMDKCISDGEVETIGDRIKYTLKDWNPQKRKAVRNIMLLLIFGEITSRWLQMLTGKDRKYYSPFDIISWEPGGLVVGGFQDTMALISDTAEYIAPFTSPERKSAAAGRIIEDVKRSAETLIPYYRLIIDSLDVFMDTKNVDTQAFKEVRSWIDDNYTPEEIEETERTTWEKIAGALLGGQPVEDGLFESIISDLNEYESQLGAESGAGSFYTIDEFGSQVGSLTEDLPPFIITQEYGFSPLAEFYKTCEWSWGVYYQLPSVGSVREQWRKEHVEEEAMMIFWGKQSKSVFESGSEEWKEVKGLLLTWFNKYGITQRMHPIWADLSIIP